MAKLLTRTICLLLVPCVIAQASANVFLSEGCLASVRGNVVLSQRPVLETHLFNREALMLPLAVARQVGQQTMISRKALEENYKDQCEWFWKQATIK